MNSNGNGYSQFDPTVYKTQKPVYTDTTSAVGGLDVSTTPQLVSIYGSPTYFNSTFFTLNHRGYFYADVTGNYNFSVTGVDDVAFIWLGSKAYSGYTRSNANMVAGYAAVAGSNYTIFAGTAGVYTPFRIMFGQAQGAIVFQMTVKAPNGTTIISGSSTYSPNVVQYGCSSANNAPAYPAWGSET